jgi:flagellar basal-body rod protein FlgC
MFSLFSIAGSGLTTHRTWLDAVSDNIANINTVNRPGEPAFQERFVVAQSVEGSSASVSNGSTSSGAVGRGVRVAGIQYGSAEGRVRYEPNNPNADADGNVRYPDMDLSDQMTSMIMAQRGYQANLSVIQRARDAYEAAINLGKN